MTAKPHILIEDRIVQWIRTHDCDEYVELLADARREIVELRKALSIWREHQERQRKETIDSCRGAAAEHERLLESWRILASDEEPLGEASKYLGCDEL